MSLGLLQQLPHTTFASKRNYMAKFFKEIYGVGILFFYYMKYIILIGWPILYYGLEYKPNMIMDILWVFCLILMIKDFLIKKYD